MPNPLDEALEDLLDDLRAEYRAAKRKLDVIGEQMIMVTGALQGQTGDRQRAMQLIKAREEARVVPSKP